MIIHRAENGYYFTGSARKNYNYNFANVFVSKQFERVDIKLKEEKQTWDQVRSQVSGWFPGARLGLLSTMR